MTSRVLAAGIAVVAVVLISCAALWLVERQRDAAERSSAHSVQVLESAAALERAASQLAGEVMPPPGPPGAGPRASFAQSLDALRRLVGRDPVEAKRIGALSSIAASRSAGSPSPPKQLFDQFRGALEQFEALEWSSETAQQHHIADAHRLLMGLGRGVTLVIVVAVGLLVLFVLRLLLTPLRRVADALRASERGRIRERDFAETVVRSMRDGFMLTCDGVILQVNPAMSELTGFSRAELVGACAPALFGARLAAGAPWPGPPPSGAAGMEFETVFTRKGGSRIPVSVSVAAVDGDGEPQLVHTVRDVSAQKRHEAELERLARQDPLTGLPNHRVFRERLRSEMARARRHGTPLSLIVLDLDHFKALNDSLGHPVGDRVLRTVGRRLAAAVRTGETLARIGGEEFAWILPGVDSLTAYAAAERARAAIADTPFAGAGAVTVSAGIGELAGGDRDGEAIYQRADQALYWAKDEGRNRTVRYAPDAAAAAG